MPKQEHQITELPADVSDLVNQLIPHIMHAATAIGNEFEPRGRALACMVAACTLVAAIEDDDVRNRLVSELTGFVKDGVKLARTMKASVEAGLTKDVAVAAAGIEGWPPNGTKH
jgi:hypothetical protein